MSWLPEKDWDVDEEMMNSENMEEVMSDTLEEVARCIGMLEDAMKFEESEAYLKEFVDKLVLDERQRCIEAMCLECDGRNDGYNITTYRAGGADWWHSPKTDKFLDNIYCEATRIHERIWQAQQEPRTETEHWERYYDNPMEEPT